MADINVGKFINNLDKEDLSSEDLQGVVNNVYAKAISDHKKLKKAAEDNTKEQDKETATFVKANHDRLKAHKNKPEKDIDKDDATAKDKVAKEINESKKLNETVGFERFKSNITPDITKAFKKLKSILDSGSNDTYVSGWYFPEKALNILQKAGLDYHINSYYDLTPANILNMISDNDTVEDAVKELYDEYEEYYAESWAWNFIDVLKKIGKLGKLVKEANGSYTLNTGKRKSQKGKFNDSTTFEQWYNATFDSPSYRKSEYYPFNNYVKIFSSAESLRNATADDIVKNAHRFYDVYDVDSADREYAFNFARDVTGIDYDDLYNAWSSGEPLAESKKLKESEDEFEVAKYKGNQYGIWSKSSKNWMTFGKKADLEKRVKELNAKKSYKECTEESLKEDWTIFEFTSGSNPYIAKTDKEVKRLLRKYKNKVKKINDTHYEVDDRTETDNKFDLFPVRESKKITEAEDGNMTIEPGDFYKVAIKELPAEDIDHHESDLYIRKTPKSTELIKKLTTDSLLSTFKSNIDGDIWYELPFCYSPFWQSKNNIEEGRSIPRNATKIKVGGKEFTKDGDWVDDSRVHVSPRDIKRFYGDDVEVIETDPNYKPKRTKEVKVLQGNYGYGWDDLVEYEKEDYAELRQDLKSYRENEKGASFRVVTRRVPLGESRKLGESIKERYKDTRKQAAYENACDCIIYGYGKSYWNSLDLNDEEKKEVWKQAFEDIAEDESLKEDTDGKTLGDVLSKYHKEDADKLVTEINKALNLYKNGKIIDTEFVDAIYNASKKKKDHRATVPESLSKRRSRKLKESEGGRFEPEELDEIFKVGAKFKLKKPLTLETYEPNDWDYDWDKGSFSKKELAEMKELFKQELKDLEQYDDQVIDKYIVLDKLEGAKLELPAGFELKVAENIPNTKWFNNNPWFAEVVFDTADGQIRMFYNSIPGPQFIAKNSQRS